jgi:hypothetical protein
MINTTTQTPASVVGDMPPRERKLRSKRLPGPIVAYRGVSTQYPKLHLDPNCKGLERVTLKETIFFDGITELVNQTGDEPWSPGVHCRPCRACALESVLYTVLGPKSLYVNDTSVFVTFTSQASPDDPGTKLHRYRWRTATPSGQKRLGNVAKRAGLSTTHSPSGLVAYGFVPTRALDTLTRNLRTKVIPGVTQLPAPSVVETFWAFENDAPTELGEQTHDAWQTASLLA